MVAGRGIRGMGEGDVSGGKMPQPAAVALRAPAQPPGRFCLVMHDIYGVQAEEGMVESSSRRQNYTEDTGTRPCCLSSVEDITGEEDRE